MKTSESILKIAAAIVAFQSEVKNPANSTVNTFFNSKYAPLGEILTAVRPILAKHGLAVLQSPSAQDATVSVTTTLFHSSGEWVESDPLTLKLDKPTAQGAGSAVTYARRYSLAAMLAISGEDDDDGNTASAPVARSAQQPQTPPKPAPAPAAAPAQPVTAAAPAAAPAQPTGDYISVAQSRRMFALAKGNTDIIRESLKAYGYTRPEEVLRANYEKICSAIEAACGVGD